MIRASAGTGKTFQLSNRFLALAATGVPADHILATTFACKAAGEILDRVLTRLAEGALDDAKLDQLRTHLERPDLSRDECRRMLAGLLAQLHRLRIGTLDSFFVQVAGAFGLELGLPAGWGIIDELDDRRLRSAAVREVLRAEETNSVVTLMLLLSKGDVVRSVAAQILEIVTDLYDLHRESRADAWRKVPRSAELPIEELRQSLEALAEATFTDKRFTNARDGDLAKAREDDWEGFIAGGFAKRLLAGESTYYKKPIDDAVVAIYEKLLEHAKSVVLGHLADRTEAARGLLEKFDLEYHRLKLGRKGLRFDDVTWTLADAFAAGTLASTAYRLDAQLDHLLLDEFQDTSRAQWRVLRPLAERVTEGVTSDEFRVTSSGDDPAASLESAEAVEAAQQLSRQTNAPPESILDSSLVTRHSSPATRSLFCVGDVKQALYGWRGGVAAIFDAVTTEFTGIEQGELTKSYRSAPVVIDAVNEVFGRLAGNPALADWPDATRWWSDRFIPHETARTELSGEVRLLVAPQAEGVARPDSREQRRATLSFAASEIARLVAAHPERGIGVLVRRNETVARLIHELRSRHEVPASEEGGNPLTDSAAVRLILSLLVLADHPGDRAARFHVATSPLGTALGFTSWQNDDSSAAAARALARDVRRKLLDEGYGRTIYEWVRQLAPECDDRELSRLSQLVELAYGYDPEATVRPRDFVQLVESQRVESPMAANVRVMTVHQSKGLQFDIVVLPELDVAMKGQQPRFVAGRPTEIDPPDRICPYASEAVRSMLPASFQRMFAERETQQVIESLCVLYVSMTRAIHSLHMIVAPHDKDCAKTFAGVLRGALFGGQPLEAGTLAWQRPESGWGDDAALEKDSTAAPSAIERLDVRLKPSAARRRRGLDRKSPSSLAGGTRVRLADRLRRDDRATSRGTLFHAWLEEIEWLDVHGDRLQPVPLAELEERLRTIARRLEFAGELEADLARLRELLAGPPLATLLSRASYADPAAIGWPPEVCAEIADSRAAPHSSLGTDLAVHRELPFAVRLDDVLVNGIIDRLVVVRRKERPIAADVIDFKTDRAADAAAIGAAAKKYAPQLAAYRTAVARMFRLDPERVVTRLAFLDAGRVVGVSDDEFR
ncbi:MAG: UvrD-helicase domain-containing protein [Planctomycetaceae bacterium]